MSASDPLSVRDAPPLRHRDVIAIAVPIILSNATVPLVGWVDTIVIGRQGGPAHVLGGVALAAVIFNNIYWIFSFLRMGTTGLTAQATGAGDRGEVLANLLRALAIAGAVGTILVITQLPLMKLFVWLMGGSSDVNGTVAQYFAVRIWSAPAALANFVLVGWFVGLGRARIAFYLQLILNCINIALALLFVMGFDWGAAGVGLAVLVAEIVACGAGLWFASRELAARGVRRHHADLTKASALWQMFAVNRDVIIRTASVIFAFSFFISQGARAGDMALAANAVLLSIAMLTVYMLDGFAYAAETLVGQAVGARRKDRFDDAIRMATQWAVGFALFLTLLLYFAGGWMIDFTTPDPAIRAAARAYLPWASLIPVVGIWCYMLDGIFVGATGTTYMRNMAVLSLVAYLGIWAVLEPIYGNDGLWMAILSFLALRAVTLGLCLPYLARARFEAGAGGAGAPRAAE